MGAAKGRLCPVNVDTQLSSTGYLYSNSNELGRGEPQQLLLEIAWDPSRILGCHQWKSSHSFFFLPFKPG